MIVSQRTVGNIGAFLFAFLLFGFPIQSFIPFILNVDSNQINVAFRIFFVIISIALIFIHFYSKTDRNAQIGWIAFILFWCIYSSRLIYDLEINNLLYLDKNKEYVYSFAFGVCLIPSMAIYFSSKYVDFDKILTLTFIVILLSNICLIYAILSFGNWNILEIILSRANVNIEIDGVKKSIINPITIGFFGEVLSIAAIHILNFKLICDKKYFKVLLYISILIGIANIVLGASRGPMFSFVILFFVELYYVAKKKSFNIIFISKVVIILSMLTAIIIYQVLARVNIEDIELLNRLSLTAEARQNDEKEERDFLYKSAWEQFLSSPIIGDSFLTKYPYQSYSHNLLLDVLMSTGIIGIIIFGIFGYYIFKSIVFKFKNELNPNIFNLLVLLYISILLISMTSGGLFMSVDFWIFSVFMLSLNNHENS